MMNIWQLQDAKNKLSEVIEDALTEGPQLITRRGKEVAIVLSYQEYQRLTSTDESLYEFFRRSPLVGVELDLSRDKSPIPDRFGV
jgi:prevent-host-death family protein